MVDVAELQTIAAEDKDVRALVKAVSSISFVTGTTLRPHPIWTSAMARSDRRRDLGYRWPFPQFPDHVDGDGLEEIDGDMNERPHDWSSWLSSSADTTSRRIADRPLLVTVLIRRETSKADVSSLWSVLQDSKVAATIERRDPLRFQLKRGDHVFAGPTFGTAGGFLTDGNDYFAVTCAHVVGAPTVVTDHTRASIGTCFANTVLTPNTRSLACDPTNPAHGLTINTEDAALIRLNHVPNPTGLSSPSTLRHGQWITFALNGGLHRCQIRSLAMSMQVVAGAASYCFKSLIEVYARGRTTLPGDSGAWGIAAGNEWALMAIGADSLSTFAVRSDAVLQWARQQRAGLALF